LRRIRGSCRKSKKILRDKKGKLDVKTKQEIVKKLWDVLWYLSSISSELEVNLEDIAKINLLKLNSRNKIKGSGDNR